MASNSTHHIFMSYSRRDETVMQRVVAFLRKQGINVWVDNEKLVPGTPIWEAEIEKAIINAGAIVVLLSQDSKNSPWVRREISYAEDNEKRIFPLLVAGNQKDTVPIRLTNHQRIDIRENEEVGLNSLTAALSFYLKEQAHLEEERLAKLDVERHEEQNRLALKQADSERKAKEEAKRISLLKAEEERLAREKAENERKAKEAIERLTKQKLEEERLAQEQVERQKAEEQRVVAAELPAGAEYMLLPRWFPVFSITVGWAISGIIAGVIGGAIREAIFGTIGGFIGGAMSGVIFGILSGITLRVRNVLSQRNSIFGIIVGWAIGGAIGGAMSAEIGMATSQWDVIRQLITQWAFSWAWGGAIGGAIGGLGMLITLRNEHVLFERKSTFWMIGGWATGMLIGAIIGFAIIIGWQIVFDNALMEGGLWLGEPGMGWGIVWAICGIVGAFVTSQQITKNKGGN